MKLRLISAFPLAFLAAPGLGTPPPPSADLLNSGFQVHYDDTIEAFHLSWWGIDDHYYFVEHSENLQNWTLLPTVEAGLDAPLGLAFQTNTDRWFWRLRYSNHPNSDLLAADYNSIGVSAWDQLQLGYNPFEWADSASSGMHDAWETFYFGGLGVDPEGNETGTGMTNLQVFLQGIDPMGVDSSGDGLPDLWLHVHGFDPAVYQRNDDPDGDGLSNIEEFEAGTDPNNWDTDGDGIPDGLDLHPLISDPGAPANFHVAVPSWEAQSESDDPDWSAVDPRTVELRWEASTNSPSNYLIERRSDNDLWHAIATLPAGATTHQDSGLLANRHYQYRIRAVKNEAGTQINSAFAATHYRVPLNLRVQTKSVSINNWKAGFSEFTSPSSPPKYYLIRTNISSFEWSNSWSGTSSGGESSGEGTYSYVSTLDPFLKKWTYTGTYWTLYESSS